MKTLKRFGSVVLALALAMTMAIGAFAQDVDTGKGGNATITIDNAAKGETYSVYKLFDATVNADGSSIAYTGTIPAELSDYFETTAGGNIAEKAAAKNGQNMSDGLQAALKTWAATQTPTATEVSDGSKLVFKGLQYGYYIVTTSQGEQKITVDSTNPTAKIYDKNSTQPTIDQNDGKTVDDDTVSIGQTVTYTLKFKASNFDGAGDAAKKIVSYTIADTLPDFLSDVDVTGIYVDQDGDITTTDDQTKLAEQQFNNKQITVAWVDAQGNSLYKNGSYVFVTYTAKVTASAKIAGDGNVNTLTVTWTNDNGNGGEEPGSGKLEASETIYTYAAAIKKVDDKGNTLAGAEFQVPYTLADTTETGTNGETIYTVVSKDGNSTVVTPDNGVVIIKGVDENAFDVTETKAPDGYNKLADAINVTPSKTSETTTTFIKYLDENGNVTDTQTNVKVEYNSTEINTSVAVVVNKTGSTLPSTGGIGTTIFYVIGGVLVAGAVVLLVVKKRADA